MKIFRISILCVFCTLLSHAQPNDIFFKTDEDNSVDYGWNTNKEIGIHFNQVSFNNWNAGGSNSISAIFSGTAKANYRNENLFWNSALNLRYGINKQEEQPFRKTDDAIGISSNFGYEKNPDSNWFYSAKFSFNTQFANGFNDFNALPISKFMTPGYLFLGVGMEYGRYIEKLSFYASPLTTKATFVLDDALANQGAFGVSPAIYDMQGNILQAGERSRLEFGVLVTNQYQDEILENVKLNSLIRLYSDYLNNFGNIDIEWELNFDFRVNKYISAILGSHLRYDDDIKNEVVQNDITNEITVIEGPKLQWKQLLGVGVVLNFDDLSGFTRLN